MHFDYNKMDFIPLFFFFFWWAELIAFWVGRTCIEQVLEHEWRYWYISFEEMSVVGLEYLSVVNTSFFFYSYVIHE